MNTSSIIEANKGKYYRITKVDYEDFCFLNNTGNKDHEINYENNKWFMIYEDSDKDKG
jgi:hypothetical protein